MYLGTFSRPARLRQQQSRYARMRILPKAFFGANGDGENGSFSVPMAHNKVIPNGLLRATHSRNPTPTFAYRVAKRHFYAHVGASH